MWYVALVYDPARRTITIRCPAYRESDLYFVREYGRGGRMRVVSAIRLLKKHGIEIEETLRSEGSKIVQAGGEPMLVLEVNKAKVSRRGWRKAPLTMAACKARIAQLKA